MHHLHLGALTAVTITPLEVSLDGFLTLTTYYLKPKLY